MSEGKGEESSFFGNIAKNQTKYGSTTKPTPKFTKYVKHIVSRVDTLMGIALKYGATVEQIKRENKLWTNDSLFLREHLYVPVTSENSHLVQDDWELLTSDEVRSRSNSEDQSNTGNATNIRQNRHGLSAALGVSNDESRNNGAKEDTSAKSTNDVANGGPSRGMDFFNKYDSSIADLKTKVDKLEQTSSYRDDNLLSLIPRRPSENAHTSRRSVSLETSDNPDSPVLIIRSHTRSHKVQSAVKRSEQANDSLFQL